MLPIRNFLARVRVGKLYDIELQLFAYSFWPRDETFAFNFWFFNWIFGFVGFWLASFSFQLAFQLWYKWDYWISGYGHEHFWTGGTDLAEEGSFFWMSSGRPIVFTNWNAGEPNNFKYENGEEEHCLELWNRDGKGLKWNDSPCSFETYFVCETWPP